MSNVRIDKITFSVFWNAYGLKRDKIAAERVWNRMSDRDRRAALAGITTYRDDCQRQGIRMMYAQGYLSHRRWEDDLSDTTEPVEKTPAPASAAKEMELW